MLWTQIIKVHRQRPARSCDGLYSTFSGQKTLPQSSICCCTLQSYLAYFLPLPIIFGKHFRSPSLFLPSHRLLLCLLLANGSLGWYKAACCIHADVEQIENLIGHELWRFHSSICYIQDGQLYTDMLLWRLILIKVHWLGLRIMYKKYYWRNMSKVLLYRKSIAFIVHAHDSWR